MDRAIIRWGCNFWFTRSDKYVAPALSDLGKDKTTGLQDVLGSKLSVT